MNLTPANIGAAASSHSHSYLPLSGGNVTGKIQRENPGGISYIAGCTGGALHVNKAEGSVWFPMVSTRTGGGGGWAIGNYNNENLQFSYGTKANINANNNSTKIIDFHSDGGCNFPGTIKQNGTAVSLSGHTHNYAAASHTHSYLPLSGGTLTGRVYSTSDVISVGYMDIDSGDNNTAALRLRSAKSFGGSVNNAIVFHKTWTESTYTIQVASDRRLKNHIDTIDKPNAVSFIKSLNPVLYSFKSDQDNEKHLGFYAQDVKDSDIWDTSIVRESSNINGTEDNFDNIFTLDYTQLHAPVIAALQSALDKIDTLESRISELEDYIETLKKLNVS